jgi:ATP-binding cassette subfamily B protein
MIDASKMAGSDSFITKFKNGYNHILSKWFFDGTEISGGQWQRVALARSFYRDANILILDEPTSAIDPKGEYEVFQTINKTQQRKTTIIISHRFSTVRNADHIYVIDQGTILEHGSHDELIENKSIYATMFEMQAQGYR